MVGLRQTVPENPPIAELAATVSEQVRTAAAQAGIAAGQTVAVGAGSRGISQYPKVLRQVTETLRELGAVPFIFPAMGSHGGATSAGQVEVLAHLGVTEATVGVPVRSEIEPCQCGITADGLQVYFDRPAAAADHIVVVNRVKAHTDFRGDVESGMMKMLSIGCGKQQGANLYHQAAARYGFAHVIRTVAEAVVGALPVAFGIALIENAREQLAHVEAVPAAALAAREPELLELAKAWQPKLPFDDLDLLIVDFMGKNISGTGMDANIIGRRMHTGEPELTSPRITRLVVRDLTEVSAGNAVGIGFADLTTTRLVNKIDRRVMYPNLITGISPQKGRIPAHFDSDREMLTAAMKTLGMVEPAAARVMRIVNTLQLEVVQVSESLARLAAEREDLTVLGTAKEMSFDAFDNLLPMCERD